MGYYTKFDLHAIDVETQEPITQLEEQIIAKRLWLMFGGRDTFNPTGFNSVVSGDIMKWYDHEDDMITLSKEFPNILFVLDGVGEEFPDTWRKWFHNGKYEASYAEVIYPKPNNPLFAQYNY